MATEAAVDRSVPVKADRLGQHAIRKGDSLAIVHDARQLTWREYIHQRNRVANAMLAAGIRAQDRVVVYGHNSIEWLTMQHVCAAIGAVHVPCNWKLSLDEVKWVFDNVRRCSSYVSIVCCVSHLVFNVKQCIFSL